MKEMMASVYWWAITHQWEVMEMVMNLLTASSTVELLFVLVKAAHLDVVTK